MFATLLIALVTFPARRVMAAITTRVMTARTTPSVFREAGPHRPHGMFGD
jgi:hypothetical protein